LLTEFVNSEGKDGLTKIGMKIGHVLQIIKKITTPPVKSDNKQSASDSAFDELKKKVLKICQ